MGKSKINRQAPGAICLLAASLSEHMALLHSQQPQKGLLAQALHCISEPQMGQDWTAGFKALFRVESCLQSLLMHPCQDSIKPSLLKHCLERVKYLIMNTF